MNAHFALITERGALVLDELPVFCAVIAMALASAVERRERKNDQIIPILGKANSIDRRRASEQQHLFSPEPRAVFVRRNPFLSAHNSSRSCGGGVWLRERQRRRCFLSHLIIYDQAAQSQRRQRRLSSANTAKKIESTYGGTHGNALPTREHMMHAT